MKKVRLDDELIAQGICADRADALRLLMAGAVSARGERLTSPGVTLMFSTSFSRIFCVVIWSCTMSCSSLRIWLMLCFLYSSSFSLEPAC